MNRIEQRFKSLAQQRKAAFIPYITAGDPTLELTARLVPELERAGADIVELGVPFSDPLADGVVNQEAALRALRHDVSLHDILAMVGNLRKTCQTPIVLFTYFNPILAYGLEGFAQDAASAGVDGVLCLDLPPEEASEYCKLMDARNIATIWLIAPTTPEHRIELIAGIARGFIYYVSRTGVTGERESMDTSIKDQVAAIKRHTSTPVAVGFGISKPAHAAEVASCADGVVVGSAIVRLMGQLGDSPEMIPKVCEFVKSLASAAKS
ncbi:MAG: tryptophan synthase subunit alpha [Candidatus Hydrogenedentes bacterium]|nr:tryptophan synthase subunit alpha [Candidatus Hydrogenedentota bacterium]